MKSRETLIRLKRFQVDDKRRQVTQLETMIAEFERMASELDTQVAAEQNRSGIHDINHFAYPTFAKAAMTRRDNLRTSVDGLKAQLAEAREALAGAFEELKKVELIDERDKEAEKSVVAQREQAEMDRIAAGRFSAR
jgi:flagellar protein FliJ